MHFEKIIALLFSVVFQISSISSKITDKEYHLMPDIFQFDDYDKCLYYTTEHEAIYCTIKVELHPQNVENSSKVWNVIQEVSASNTNYRHDLLRHGVCTSTLCSNHNGTISECLSQIYSNKYKNLGLVGEIKKMRCETEKTIHDIGTPEVVVIVLFAIYIAFIIIVTVWLEYTKYRTQSKAISAHKKKFQSFLSIFSLVDNISSIIVLKPSTKNRMLFLETIRFGASVIAIIIHVIMCDRYTPVSNPLQVEKDTAAWLNLLVINGGMLVQTFFVISSWLMAISFFKKLRDEGAVGFDYVVQSIVRRYIRFASGEIVMIALNATWLVHLSRGPFWESIMGREHKMCRDRWWTILLFFNNFAINEDVCLVHTWYLAEDFQFAVLGLLILWLTQKKLKHLFLALGVVVAFQVVFMFVYLASNSFELGVILTPELYYYFTYLSLKEWHATWTSAYSNLSGLAFGILFGFLQTKYQKEFFFTNSKHVTCWCILTPLLVFGTPMLSSYYMTSQYYATSRWFSAAYGSINKALYVFGIGLWIFGMAQGLGGIIKKVFEWAPMHTLGRLSFGAYLVHFTLLCIDIALRRRPYFVSNYSLMCGTIVNVVLAYLFSLILTVFVLTPMDGLSKKLVKLF